MRLDIGDGLEINYEVYGSGRRLLLLHGWGSDLHTFDRVTPRLAESFQVLAVDLPGFGLSPLNQSFGLDDYARATERFLEKLEINETFVLGHSFGGAVALHLAAFSTRVTRMILENSAGLYPKSPFIRLKIFLYKLLKKSFPDGYSTLIKKIFGSVDYKNSGPMRSTLIKVVGSSVLPLLTKIQVPTLIVWGKDDELTTIEEARTLKSGIRNSSVVLLSGCGHFPHLEKSEEFVKIVTNFLEK